jgi:hydrogenase maturation protein HypF
VGRLFDAVASLLNLRQIVRFEGQAAMDLEFAADVAAQVKSYILRVGDVVDWEPMIREMLAEIAENTPASIIAARFHVTLAEMIVAVARRASEKCVVLSGGCFQNRPLTEFTVERLRASGFRPYWHQRVPPNDGGIALGQILAAARLAAT